jgi:hypothetical protein
VNRSEDNRDDFAPVEERLRAARGELSPIELDQAKRRAMSHAGGKRMNLKSRLVTGLLMLGLIGTGGGAVLAASNGSSDKESAAKSQYCPPSSPGAGKPKDPHNGGNKCGHCPEDGSSQNDKKCCDDGDQQGDKKNKKCCDDGQQQGKNGKCCDDKKGNKDKCGDESGGSDDQGEDNGNGKGKGKNK